MATSTEPVTATQAPPINAVVAMIRVREIERSVKFYQLLGFEIGNYEPREGPPMHWCWLYQPHAPDWKTGANLMLVRGSNEGWDSAPDTHVVLYVYAKDLVATRERMLAAGVKCGEICYPEYLPKGEFASHDPDDYGVMVAQSYEKSP